MDNHNAYIRLPKVIINKTELCNILNTYDKVELINTKNHKLNNPNLIKIIPYKRIDFNDLSTIIGCCEGYVYLKIPLLNGIRNSKAQGFIKHKILKKLIEIEQKYKINLSISKDIRNKIS